MITIVLGYKGYERTAEVVCLYNGHSGAAAEVSIVEAPEDVVRVEIYKNPVPTKRKTLIAREEVTPEGDAKWQAGAEAEQKSQTDAEAKAKAEATVKAIAEAEKAAAEKAKAEQLSQPAVIANAPGSGQAEGSSSEDSKSDQKSEGAGETGAAESKTTISTPTTLENKGGSEGATKGGNADSPGPSDSKVDAKDGAPAAQSELLEAPPQAGRKAGKAGKPK